jgi:hypothetical protein
MGRRNGGTGNRSIRELTALDVNAESVAESGGNGSPPGNDVVGADAGVDGFGEEGGGLAFWGLTAR